MNKYIIYLRKSRLDNDFAESSVEETLKRHEKVLTELASSRGYNVDKIYKEVASGESINQRPCMQQLLEDVSTGAYDGVIVMDNDRLSRGSSFESGYISQVFQVSGTKIVTPGKTYDLSIDQDEQFSDMKFLFSRYEYKAITGRMERGRKLSAAEGRYMGSTAPFGYDRVKIKGDKGYTLEINEYEAAVVRKIFDWYLAGAGYRTISERLNDMGIPTRNGKQWSMPLINVLICNPVYCGKIRMSYKKTIKVMENGSVVKKRVRNNEAPVYDGLHEGIISEEVYNRAQDMRRSNNHNSTNKKGVFSNFFAGLIYCKDCGGKIVRQKSRGVERLICLNNKCTTSMSAPLDLVEQHILAALKVWLADYKVMIETPCEDVADDIVMGIEALDNEIDRIKVQIDKICSFLEQGVYDVNTFTLRNDKLQESLSELVVKREKLLDRLGSVDTPNTKIVPKIERILESYDRLSVEEKHHLYKEILMRVDYHREKQTKAITVEIQPFL